MPETMPEDAPNTVDVVVIGAGFAGLYMLHRARGLGLRTTVLEAADGVGGTWYWNRYPGARCDSESHYYCYSFSSTLEQDWEWSERYPGQEEVRAYLDHVADRFDLRRDIRFGTRVASAHHDPDGEPGDDGAWTVHTEDARTGEPGPRWRARFLVTAVGCLSAANVPDIPGLASFAGTWHHTGQWPHDGVDVRGQRVGVVGTGSTGIQAIPVLAEAAEHLTVFQRTANYSIPARNAPLSPEHATALKTAYPELRALQRASTNGHPYLLSDRSAHDVGEADRAALYQDGWDDGGLRFRARFSDILSDAAANETAAQFIRDKIHETVHDPAVAETLTPRDHPFAAKRPPIDTGYFETYNRENVTLVDVRADPIEEITSTGIRTATTEHPLDVIVFATGFDALTRPLLSLDLRGREGRRLADQWRDGPQTYLGLAVSGFPNLFTITGPGSPSVLTNMPTAIEQHVDWIADCLARAVTDDVDLEARPDAERAWGRHVAEAADATLLPRAESSWYLGANVPGKPRVFMPYAGGLNRYRATCDPVAADDYRGFVRTRRHTKIAIAHLPHDERAG